MYNIIPEASPCNNGYCNRLSNYLYVQANITVLAWAKGGLFIVVGEKVILFILLAYLVAVAYIGWASVSGAYS